MGRRACAAVDPGGDPRAAQVAHVVYDEDLFYCQVQPNVLTAQSCSPGDATKDPSGGCHATATAFRVLALSMPDQVTCDGNGKHTGTVSQVAQSNYSAAQ